ncbi:hypothetical protein BJ508DRAFT_113336, partial [Ascobolus immersus RN42]
MGDPLNWWDEFTNNLSTDLAPLIALFGENPTKQYLSECINNTDVFIFAMAPLGILTTLVSVIPVSGTTGLRAFVGRAKEGAGQVEAELLSSTSREVCELYNNGGIARVFGRPKLLEVVYDKSATNEQYYRTKETWDQEPKAGIYPLKEYLLEQCQEDLQTKKEWIEEKDRAKRLLEKMDREENRKAKEALNFAPNPNLSLNVGIRQRSKWVFTLAAVTGFILQSSVLVWAFVARYRLGFLRDGTADAYGVPMSIIGTILLCGGMGQCAWLIERKTKERVFNRVGNNNPSYKSQIYWLQPGNQFIGDQAFDSFAYSDINSPLRTYTTSWKANENGSTFHTTLLWLGLGCSILGFILQFLGMRACHSSIIIGQLAATTAMSIIRGMLRTDRVSLEDNVLGDHPGKYQGHELDWLALHIDTRGVFVRNAPETNSELGYAKECKQRVTMTEWEILREPARVYSDIQLANEDMLQNGIERVQCCNKNTGSDQTGLSVFVQKKDAFEPWATEDWRKRAQSDASGNRPNPSATVHLHRIRLCQLARKQDWGEGLIAVRALSETLANAMEGALTVLLGSSDVKLNPGLKWEKAFQMFWSLHCSVALVGWKEARGAEFADALQLSIKRGINKRTGRIEGSWKVDRSELESLLGLWIWSLSSKFPPDQSRSFKRLIAPRRTILDLLRWSDSASEFEKLVEWQPSKGYNSKCHPEIFGWQNLSEEEQISGEPFLAQSTQQSLAVMCAQEVFCFFLRAIVQAVEEIGGTTEVTIIDDNDFLLSNTTISRIQQAFTSSKIGTHEDGLCCILGVLQRQRKLPSLTRVLGRIRSTAAQLVRNHRLEIAERLLLWGIQQFMSSNASATINQPGGTGHEVFVSHSNCTVEEVNSLRLLVFDLCEYYRRAIAGSDRSKQELAYSGFLALFKGSIYGITSSICSRVEGLACPTSWQVKHDMTLAEVVLCYGLVAYYHLGVYFRYHDHAENESLYGDFRKIEQLQQVMEKYSHDSLCSYDSGDALVLEKAINSTSPARILRSLCTLEVNPHSYSASKLDIGQSFLLAVRNGWYFVVKAILDDKRYKPRDDEQYLETVLLSAIDGRDINTLNLLLDSFLTPNASHHFLNHGVVSTSLVIAAERGWLGGVTRLIQDNRVEINAKVSGKTALEYATLANQNEVVSGLLDTGRVELGYPEKGSDSVLGTAVRLGNSAIVQRLLRDGLCNEEYRAQEERLCLNAVKVGSYEVLELLLKLRTQLCLNDFNYLKRIVLTEAIDEGRPDIVQLLLTSKAVYPMCEIWEQSLDGYSSWDRLYVLDYQLLEQAITTGSSVVLEVLLEYVTRTNTFSDKFDSSGRVRSATVRQHHRILYMALRLAVDQIEICIKSSCGNDKLYYDPLDSNRIQILRLLLQSESTNPYSLDNDYGDEDYEESLIMKASSHDRDEAMAILLEYGKSKEEFPVRLVPIDESPFWNAIAFSRLSIAEMLVLSGKMNLNEPLEERGETLLFRALRDHTLSWLVQPIVEESSGKLRLDTVGPRGLTAFQAAVFEGNLGAAQCIHRAQLLRKARDEAVFDWERMVRLENETDSKVLKTLVSAQDTTPEMVKMLRQLVISCSSSAEILDSPLNENGNTPLFIAATS